MTTFVLDPNNKFDPENDPHKPKVGDSSPDGDGVISKVETISASDLVKQMMGQMPEPELGDAKNLLVVDNPTRPFVKYLVWVKSD